MSAIAEYVLMHTGREICTCGNEGCGSRVTDADKPKPGDQIVDLVLVRVAIKNANNAPVEETFYNLTAMHKAVRGEQINPFDGEEHIIFDLIDWFGDSSVAFRYMALGVHLGVFDLLTPLSVLPNADPQTARKLAAMGMLMIKRKSEDQKKDDENDTTPHMKQGIASA